MIDAWEWPQWVAAGVYALSLVMHISMHGEKREPYNAPEYVLCMMVGIWLLYEGGFWTVTK